MKTNTRLEFLRKAEECAQDQCRDSSCLPDHEWKEIRKRIKNDSDEDREIIIKAKSILQDAFDDIETSTVEPRYE